MNTDLAAQHALDRLKKGGPEALTNTEKTVAAAWLFEAGVANHGFASYYSGHRGELAREAPAALSAIGAKQLSQIAAEANAVFGLTGLPADRDARRALVQALPVSARLTFEALEHRYYECEEDIDALLEQFLDQEQGTK